MEFFTWVNLATFAGCLAATLAITQLFKGVGFIQKIPTQIFSYIVALVILEAAYAAIGAWTLETGGLCVLNAAIVSLAANGGFEGIKSVLTSAGIIKDPGGDPEEGDDNG